MSFVSVTRFDDFAAQLARVKWTGLMLVQIMFGHLFHGAFDQVGAQLALPTLIRAAAKE